jgi:two-component system, OmpR family, alkaline phosphatase synthesis response regulator PhoP
MEHLFPVILLVDDDDDILAFMRSSLEKEGNKVYSAKNGIEGLKLALKILPDIIVIDNMNQEKDGISTCRELRSMKPFQNTFIVMLTAYGNDQIQSTAFEAGVDVFISKPIRSRLFLCRINALLKRRSISNSSKHLTIFESMVIDSDAYIVEKNNQKISLSKKELQLLMFLISKPGKVFNRDEIMSHVWGQAETCGDRTIDVHVKKLRNKIGADHIKTIKGIGYFFMA